MNIKHKSNILPIEYLISNKNYIKKLKPTYFIKNKNSIIKLFIISLIRQHILFNKNLKNKFIWDKIKITTDNLIKTHNLFNINNEYQEHLINILEIYPISIINENYYIQLKFLLYNSELEQIRKI